MNYLVEVLVAGIVMLVIGACLGAMVNRPLAGILLTLFLGPVGWIVLFIWARDDEKVKKESLKSVKSDPDQVFRAGSPTRH